MGISPIAHLITQPSTSFIGHQGGRWPKVGNPRPFKASDEVIGLLLPQQSCCLVLGGHVDVGQNGVLHLAIFDPKDVGLNLLVEALDIREVCRCRLIWFAVSLASSANIGSCNLDHCFTGIAALKQLNQRLG